MAVLSNKVYEIEKIIIELRRCDPEFDADWERVAKKLKEVIKARHGRKES